MYCIEESACDTVGTFFRTMQWFGAREIVPRLPPRRYAPAYQLRLGQPAAQ